MDKNDFRVEANGRGYMIYYKNKSIGGAGIASSARGPRGRGVWPQVQAYIEMGKREIAQILSGHGSKYMLSVIKEIDETYPSNKEAEGNTRSGS